MDDLTALLLEDDDADARLIELLLEEAGLRVRCLRAARLSEATALAADEHFDVALVDLNLPDSVGVDTVSAIQSALPDTPLVVMTGTSSDEVCGSALNAGAQDYLPKADLEPHRCARAIRYAIDRHTIVRDLHAVIASQEAVRHQQEETDRLRAEFIAIAGHELRTPITVIAGALELLEQLLPLDELPPRTAQLWGATQRQTRRLAELVDDLLLVSRLEQGPHAANVTSYDALQALNDGIEASGVDPSRLTLSVRSGATLIGIRDQLVRIVANLVSNADRYGAPPIEIELVPDGERWRLSVTDHGPGVGATFVPHLFEPFSQERSEAGHGAGLGLRITQRLAEDAGGSLSYEAPTGGGARFVVELPRIREVVAPEAEATAHPST